MNRYICLIQSWPEKKGLEVTYPDLGLQWLICIGDYGENDNCKEIHFCDLGFYLYSSNFYGSPVKNFIIQIFQCHFSVNSNPNINATHTLWWIDSPIRKLGKNGVWWGEVGLVGDPIVIGSTPELPVKNKN